MAACLFGSKQALGGMQGACTSRALAQAAATHPTIPLLQRRLPRLCDWPRVPRGAGGWPYRAGQGVLARSAVAVGPLLLRLPCILASA